jgi:hypothetical protein
MTRLLEPIYGEVRTLGNRVRMGATVGMTPADVLKGMNLDEITRGWFWRAFRADWAKRSYWEASIRSSGRILCGMR